MCTWEGIMCDTSDDHVIQVNLANFGMTGTWGTTALAGINTVQTMQLDGNFLQGSISPYYSAIASLQILSMIGNSFSGTIPPVISLLLNLEEFVATQNNLSARLTSSGAIYHNYTQKMFLGEHRIII
eukprot:TRINITY_DN19562_c2_g1_i1.p4 TRINITY_DN19562_c2_g1~~TRINITY_DN19562_c2_g1_i1.p4  ORF type:complete len:141 (-),score=0.08 TRINITY_DN19562_c2_g1_i1:594-974(-)